MIKFCVVKVSVLEKIVNDLNINFFLIINFFVTE